MANKEYYSEWLKLKHDIDITIDEDVRVQQFAKDAVGLKPQATAVEIVSRVYCKYCDIFNKICDIYDQTMQPQRQLYLKKLIEALTCRIFELKAILEEVEVFEYTYPENALQQMLMVPQDIQILCPVFYSFEMRQKELQYIVDEILSGHRLGDPTPTPSEVLRIEEEKLEQERILREEKEADIARRLALGEDIPDTSSEIVLSPKELEELRLQQEFETHAFNIQRMERSRMVIREITKKKNKDLDLYLELAGLKAPKAKESLRCKAAEFICDAYRLFMKLKRESMRENKIKEKLDMVIPAYQPPSQKIQLEKVRQVRREFRRKYFNDWVKATIKEKTRVFRLREGNIMEDISDEIREWWWDWWKECKVFDEFPYPDEGGSILVVRGETFTTEEFIAWREVEVKRLLKEAQNPKTKEDIKAERLAAKEEKKRIANEAKEREKKRLIDYKKQRLNPDSDPGIYLKLGEQIGSLQESWMVYENQWKEIERADAALDMIKGHIMQIITENVYQEIQLELRPIVDEMMRLELVALRNALKLECAITGTTVSITQKRKKPKRIRPPKPDKVAPERLFQILVDNGIVKKYPRVTLDDFLGEENLAAADMRAILWTPSFPPACIGDIKEQVRVRCLMTLCSSCPNIERTQLFVGPKASGKKTLTYAIATETNSILMDLSPMNIYDKFPGAKGLKTLCNLVQRVCRIMQPVVILVENADKLFYKMVPKEEKDFDPSRLAKDFVKDVVKPLKKEKVLIIGTAAEPWVAKAALLRKAFPTVILMPRSDYASISFILTKLLMQYQGVDREFNVHSLAQALRGYDIQSIKTAVSTVLTGKRIAELPYKPLQPTEILNGVLNNDNAVYTDYFDTNMFWQWYVSYTPWGEKLGDYMKMIETQFEFKLKADKKKKAA